MRKSLLLFFLLLVNKLCFSQYTVTKVVGKVTNKTSGEPLKPGSKLKDDDLLAFSTSNDILRVIVAGKGIYVISPSPKSQKSNEFWVEMLKSALHIKSKEGYLSGREENTVYLPATLETEDQLNSRLLIAAENKYVFDSKVYNPVNGSRFFLQIEYPDSNPVIRPLRTVGDTLILYAADFETANREGFTKGKYKLGFYSKDKNSSESIIEIRPYVDKEGEMETIIRLIISESIEKDPLKLQQASYAEVYEALGKPSDIVFQRVFHRLMAEHSKK